MTPRSETLANVAAQLESEAVGLEADRSRGGGELTGPTVPELLAGLETLDPLTLGPSVADLLAAGEEIANSVEAAAEEHRDAGRNVRLSLTVWFANGALRGPMQWSHVAAESEPAAA